MTIQSVETFVWGFVKKSPQELQAGTTVDLGVHSELKVLDPDSIALVEEDANEWEGSELTFQYKKDEINRSNVHAEGDLWDAFRGHKISYQWAPSEPTAA